MSFLAEIYDNVKALGRVLTDAYHHTTGAAYANEGREQNQAVFYLFGRKEGCSGGYTVAAGLELLVDVVNRWKETGFSEDDIAFLKAQKTPSDKRKFTDEQIDRFIKSELKLKIDAVPEGTLVFPQEPLLRVEGPVDQAKMIESVALCIYNGQSAYATHGARLSEVLSKELPNGSPKGSASVQGLRRGPALGAAFESSRGLEIGGYTSTSTGAAGKVLGQAYAGTMDHAWIMTHENEIGTVTLPELFKMRDDGHTDELKQALKKDAFRSFVFTFPESGILLVDTYSPEQGLENAITVIKELHNLGEGKGYGIRFDSGDLVKYSKLALRRFVEEGFVQEDINKDAAREDAHKLNDAELLKKYGNSCTVFCAAADGIDEYSAQEMREQGAYFKSWGVGTGGSHVPPLGLVYKASAMFMDVTDGKGMPEGATMTPVMKVASHAPVKSSNPGRINSQRVYDAGGKLSHVVIYDEDLGLHQEGKAINLRDFSDQRSGMSNHGGETNGILVPVFDKDCDYVYKEPPKRESFEGSGKMVTDLSAIAYKVKEQLETLPEGVRRVVRPRDELIKNGLLAQFKTADKKNNQELTVDMNALKAALPPEVEHIPVFLDQNLFEQRKACEEKHTERSNGQGVAAYNERFNGGNDPFLPGASNAGDLQTGGPSKQTFVA